MERIHIKGDTWYLDAPRATIPFYRLGDGAVVLEGRSRHCLQHPDGRFIRMGKEYPDFDKALRDLAQETKREP